MQLTRWLGLAVLLYLAEPPGAEAFSRFPTGLGNRRGVALQQQAIGPQVGPLLARKSGGNKRQAPQQREKPEKKPKDDCIEVEGKVMESLPNAMFRVQIQPTETVILCTVSGKIRRNYIRILVGDRVSVEMSPYDLSRGRISFRYVK